jgi:uncharacterized protein YbaA (DUF1428 family)
MQRKKSEKNEGRADELVEESQDPQELWSYLTEQDIMRIRDKSNLPLDVRQELRGEVPFDKLRTIKQYRRDLVQKYYAKHGEATGIKPGVCWGTIQENEFKLKYEETFYPDLKTLLENDRKEKVEAKEKLDAERADILAKLKTLPKAMAEFKKKLDQKNKEESVYREKKEKQIQEVREYLGYDIAPGDTRFQEALQKKEDEEKAVLKASKKQEKQAKIMAKLAQMADEELKKAQESDASLKRTENEAGAPKDIKENSSKQD